MSINYKLFFILFTIIIASIMCDDTNTPTYYNIRFGNYLNDSLKFKVSIGTDTTIKIFQSDSLVNTIRVKTSTFIESDPTNSDYASMFQYFQFDNDSLLMTSFIIEDPGIIAFRYQDCDLIKYGIILSSDLLIRQHRNYFAEYPKDKAILLMINSVYE